MIVLLAIWISKIICTFQCAGLLEILGIINAKSANRTGKEIPGTIHYYSVNGTSYIDPERFDVKIQYIKGGKVIADYYFTEYDKNEPIQLSYYYSEDGKMSRK